MRKFYLMAGMWAALFAAKAQQVATFEEIDLQLNSYSNGSDGSGGFLSGGIWFPNSYNADSGFWSGFAASNKQDTITPGWGNQYSAITAGGVDGSENYAVVYIYGKLKMELNVPASIEGLYVTNDSYPYLSMRDGDDFSKKFGGPDGTDPDYFLLRVSGIDSNGNHTDTVDFFLADYRPENQDEDYIVKDWRWLDLGQLGVVEELHFIMESSDMSEWGMNTPAYFCIDNFTTADVASYTDEHVLYTKDVEIFPNPVTDIFQVVVNAPADDIVLTDGTGKIIYRTLVNNQKKISISALNNMPSGLYYLTIYTEKGASLKKIIKY